ncbi:MAG: beta-lactamase family protein [Clostridioides sp.]|nr:beta-lactamase family protein [Clostridioides sp.]
MKSEQLIKEIVTGHQGVRLTVGKLENGITGIKTYDEPGEEILGETYRYQIGSLTKVFSGIVLAELLANNHIAIDTRINQIITNLLSGSYPTIRQVATHTSGFSMAMPYSWLKYLKIGLSGGTREKNPYFDALNEQAVLKGLENFKFDSNKRYRYAYSNFGYAVVGLLISRLVGLDYKLAMEKWLHELGLNETNFENHHLAPCFDKKNNKYKPWEWQSNVNNVGLATGGLNSSAYDLLKFTQFYLSEDSDVIRLTHSKLVPNVSKSKSLGMGWDLCGNYIEKGGATGTHFSYLKMDKVRNKAVVILLNYPNIKIGQLGDVLINE